LQFLICIPFQSGPLQALSRTMQGVLHWADIPNILCKRPSCFYGNSQQQIILFHQ